MCTHMVWQAFTVKKCSIQSRTCYGGACKMLHSFQLCRELAFHHTRRMLMST